jgi:hypothetical protein
VERCPVCGELFWPYGPDGVFVHLISVHADSAEARWVMRQLGVLPLAPSGQRAQS